ncbi:two component transcriptional regulator, LuxR family [Geodermatophilus amargosae]|uniref:Two component transcriptional regulator, LuxR family n=1 Tax=Geodermatophilus amargosae TaxID=1296565 RepID=A0A1I7BXY9_9ACTN|nr:two component transcriptional regulator, LuxR family [Geodermatophilus amargosae]
MGSDDVQRGYGPMAPRPRGPVGPAQGGPAPGRWPPPRPRSLPRPTRPLAIRPPCSLVRVLLCEDREVFRLGLREVLETEPDIAVVAERDTLPAALAAVEEATTQVVVARQGLVQGPMLPVLRELCGRGTAVLVLAEPREEGGSELVQVLRAGVRGYLPRCSAASRLVEAVRALARHEPAIDSSTTSQLVRYLTDPATAAEVPDRVLDRLTDRQREVAELVAQGLSNEEIARRLFLSLATVKSHLTASMRRLGVRSRTQVAILVNRDRSPAA